MDFNRVLVAVDFSPASVAAVHRARSLASTDSRSLQLELVHVVDAHVLSVGSVWTDPRPVALVTPAQGVPDLLTTRERLAALARSRLEAFAADHCARGVAHLAVAFGRPADAICAQCTQVRPDLVVVGAHSRSALGRLLLGSVAENVARHAPVPVLVVRERPQPHAVKRVIVAIDPCEAEVSQRVLLVGRDLARRTNAELLALAVVTPVSVAPMPEVAAIVPDFLERAAAHARRVLMELVPLAPEGATAVEIGLPAAEVCRSARPGDIIVCGTHGRGLLGRMVLGSVSTRILRRAPCPVLVIPPTMLEGGPAAGTRATE